MSLALAVTPAVAKDIPERTISLQEFVRLAALNDTEFEQILIDELALQYEDDLQLPPRDIVLGVKVRYDAFLSQDRNEPEAEVSLDKLFPLSGTEVSLGYETSPAFRTDETRSGVSLGVSQPLARNAFGRSTRLLKKIVGLEVEVASHQIVEAYEDYLAAIITAYHEWDAAYEDMLVGRSSYRENLKLLDNIKERQAKQVARPIDVNKITLLVLAKKERLVELEEAYSNRLHTIQRVIRHDGKSCLVPRPDPVAIGKDASFEETFRDVEGTARTFSILRLLEERSALEVEREADDLFPSLNLLVGGEIEGDEAGLKESEDLLYVGLEFEWPFPNQVDRAEHEVSKIEQRKTELSTVNTRYRLYTNLKNLFYSMERERQLMAIAEEKIQLAQSILEDEAENYSYGKVSLNDYIDAVNVVDNNRFAKILHESHNRKLRVEWLRLSDRLVTEKDIQERHSE